MQGASCVRCVRKRSVRRPRNRCCLLKGCEQCFHPRRARQRYCSEECRKAARKWERWKAQQRYRETAAGKQKRNGQSRRYRERVKSRKPPEPEAGTVRRPDRLLPAQLYQRGISASVIENAFVLAATRRLVRPADAPPLSTIRSLTYFMPVVEEVKCASARITSNISATRSNGLPRHGRPSSLASRCALLRG